MFKAGFSIWSFPVILFVAAFVLNWIWEMTQMFAYVEMREQPASKTILFCALASVGDAVLTVVGYGLGAKLWRNRAWGINYEWKPYALMSLFGAVSAVIIEIAAINLGLWSYNEAMPSVSFIKVGILPLLQLALLMPAALLITVWWYDRKKEEK